METIKLVKPVMINDKEVAELHFDFNKLTSADFFDLEQESRMLGEITPNIVWGAKYRAMVAVKACKENIKFEDIRDLMTFKDVAKITEAAGNFLQFLD